MTKLNSPECPNQETLTNFLLGKLDPETSNECESHLAKCDPCVETVHGLNINDTFHSLIVESAADAPVEISDSDHGVVENLIHRMVDAGRNTHPKVTSDQRAADVIALLGPAKNHDSIGQIEHYRIEKVLGCGSTGVVFLAIDENLDRTVAIKVLRPTLGDAAKYRFIEEAKATAKLDHTNIVTIFHVGESDSLAFIVMQWLPGETLEERLERDGVLRSETVKKFGIQIANGLSAAHEKGLVHRDIKPANLWITQDEQVKILDFGLVRIMDESPQLTCTGMIAGTPCYMSPEQSRGDELDSRSDLFSLGCVLYQSLTGKLPFASANALATLQAIQRVQPESPASLEPATEADLSDLVMCLLEKSPHRRPDSASDVSAAFELERAQWPFEFSSPAAFANARPSKEKPLATSKPFSFWPTVALALLAGAFGWAAFLFGPQIIRIATNKGEIVIETNDPDIEVEILSGGEQILIVDLKTRQNIEISSGSYEIRAVGDQNSISIDKEKLTLSRGESEIVTVTKKETSDPASEYVKETFIPDFQMPNLERTNAPSTSNLQRQPARELSQIDPNHKIGPGDVLDVFIQEVFGSMENANANAGNFLGLPVPVRSDGSISLPFIEPLAVSGKTALEIENALRKKYIGEIIREDGFNHISVSIRSVYGGTSQKLLNEPVFDGMTFEQCFNAVKFERDGHKLKNPIEGITVLKDAKSSPELVEPMLQAIIRVRGVDYSSDAIDRFFNWLTDKQFQELALRVSKRDSAREWSVLTREFDEDRRWARLKPIEDQLVSSALDSIGRDGVEDWPVKFLSNVLNTGNVSEKSIERIIDPLMQHHESDRNSYSVLNSIVQVRPKTKGLGLALSNAIEHYRYDVRWREILAELEEDELKKAIGAFARRYLMRKGTATNQGDQIFLTDISESVFAIAKKEYELFVERQGNATPTNPQLSFKAIIRMRNQRGDK